MNTRTLIEGTDDRIDEKPMPTSVVRDDSLPVQTVGERHSVGTLFDSSHFVSQTEAPGVPATHHTMSSAGQSTPAGLEHLEQERSPRTPVAAEVQSGSRLGAMAIRRIDALLQRGNLPARIRTVLERVRQYLVANPGPTLLEQYKPALEGRYAGYLDPVGLYILGRVLLFAGIALGAVIIGLIIEMGRSRGGD